jgi:predicted DNA-binding protein
MAMRRTAVLLREDQLERLNKLYEASGAVVAELIRRAIDAYLDSRSSEFEEKKRK